MKHVTVVAVLAGFVAGVAWAAVQTGPATSTQPAQTAPATTTQPATAPGRRAAPVPVTGRADPRAPGYIVLLESHVDAKAEVARLEAQYGFKAKYTYDMGSFKGFAATMPAEVVEKLRWELTVKSIEHDASVSIN